MLTLNYWFALRPGRPRTPASVEALISQLARENIWGYKKIQGELKKLGIEISEDQAG